MSCIAARIWGRRIADDGAVPWAGLAGYLEYASNGRWRLPIHHWLRDSGDGDRADASVPADLRYLAVEEASFALESLCKVQQPPERASYGRSLGRGGSVSSSPSGSDVRPDPDRLLANVQREMESAQRGKLRIFFGASAGVGKTYAMLESARGSRAAGGDIVVGYVEPHGRAETERLLEGLERLPTLPVSYRGIQRQELDLDRALLRRPTVLVVDELAHTNPLDGDPPQRHEKRWQDIDELLAAGISVWTTVNVQHLESLNDLVAGITGIRQQETVPDHVFEGADEVELIDLPPEDLLQRLRTGKVYTAEQAQTAVQRFFKKENLTALRELALRKTADRVDAAMNALEATGTSTRPWLARDRLIIAPDLGPHAEQVVRAGKRIADGLDAEWTVLYVETPAMVRLLEANRNRRVAILRFAESLGADTVTLDGPSTADTILEYARTRRATRIIVGAAPVTGLRGLLRERTVDRLIRGAAQIDVIVIGRDSAAPGRARDATSVSRDALRVKGKFRWSRYAWALSTTLAATGIDWLIYPSFELSNLVMVYLLGAAISGFRFGRGPAIATSIANVAAFDFFFVPPRFTFAVSDLQYLLTFAVMLAVAFAIASLMASIRQQTRIAGHRERRTAALYAMSRELTRTRGVVNMAAVAVRHVDDVFASRAMVLLPDKDGRLQYPQELAEPTESWRADLSIADWVYHHNQPAGLGTGTLAASRAFYLPIHGSSQTYGVLAVLPSNPRRILLPEQRHLLETFAGQLALAMERALLADASEAAQVAAESESLRNTLLASISHDLRTPLAVITGASTALADPALKLDGEARAKMATAIGETAREMSDLISDVLDLMRFESGEMKLRRDWQTLDDLLGMALNRVEVRMAAYPVELRLPDDLPVLYVDASLMTQVFANLLENVTKHAPPGTRTVVTAGVDESAMLINVEDDGPGLPPGDPERLFQKFHRGRDEGAAGGAGLGLAICRAVVAAHGGSISARHGAHGGACFTIRIPVGEPLP